jgi:hypothetical protein
MLDFTQSAKRFLAVNLIDQQLIRVRMPTKRVFDALMGLRDKLSGPIMDDARQLDEIYGLIAIVLSNNLEHTEITHEYLAELFDIEDVQTFFQAIHAFIRRCGVGPKLQIPSIPDSRSRIKISVSDPVGTAGHDHTGFEFREIGDLQLDEYLGLRRDAYIYMLNQSEEGRHTWNSVGLWT